MGTTTDAGGLYPPGTVLAGRYRTVSLLGKGGMGEVYLADDLVLEEPVALKFLPIHSAENPDLMARFLAEVRLARKVTHPNVARVHDIAEADGRTFLSMEYVDGEDLHQLLKRIGRLPAEKAVEISKQICEGLHAAHEQGVLHRDLKPANVMLDGEGRVRLTDFGLAELARESTQGRVMGTPAYMSPEQITGGEVSVRSDVYSLGLLLYELFTGRRAFQGKSMADYQRLQQHESPSRPSTVLEQMDPAVEAVILRCIEKAPDARPVSARQVTLALPGGDPLAAALASGATPAPELVAAAGSQEAPPVPVVCGLFLGWVVLFAALLFLAPEGPTRPHLSPDAIPPAVLGDRIASLLESVGYVTPPEGSADWFRWDRKIVELREQALEEDAADEPDAGPLPTPLTYTRRLSPQELSSSGMRFTEDDPAPTLPGMISVRTDATGRLLRLAVVPGGPDGPGGPEPAPALPDGEAASGGAPAEASDAPPPLRPEQLAVAPDTWDLLLAAAEIERAALTPVEPAFLPPMPSSERHAWRATLGGVPGWRLRAAGLGGMPVMFELEPPRPEGSEGAGAGSASPWFNTLPFLVLLGLMILAWRNVHTGRADPKGGLRLGTIGFTTHLVYWLGMENHSASSMLAGFGYWTLIGAFQWLSYLSLEPFVRKRWPTAIISWTRFVRGRVLDPLIGRDILVGGGAMLAGLTLLAGTDIVFRANGLGGEQPSFPIFGLESWWTSLAATVHVLGDAVSLSFLLILPLVLLRSVIRVAWLGTLTWFVLIVGMSGPGFSFPASLPPEFAFELVFGLGFATLFWVLLTRFGVVACIVAMCVAGFWRSLPVAGPDDWFSHVTVMVALGHLGLAAWGWRSAMAGRPVFGPSGS
jgi:serine/threonine-protein kinase